ncbi:hypothetical protein V1264_012212 [Littorina saxatilis]
MEAQLKSRSRAVPKSVGRTVGVLPIETRKPIPPRLPPSSSTGTRKPPSSRASSTTSYRSLASSRSTRSQSNIVVPDIDLDGGGDDVRFTNVPGSATSSARSAKSAITKSQEEQTKQKKKKTFSAAEILAMCQEEDFYKVYEVDLHGAEITHIPDLEKFRKLRVADLSGNHIRKIENIDFTQDLRDLKLYDNEITTVEGLNNLKELCNLQLQHNKIEHLGKSLTSQKKLKCLRLDSNQLTKLENNELLSCVQLTSLDLSNNRITNLSALGYLPNLEELFVSGNRLHKLADLHKCTKLQEVDLSRNLITDLSGISGLPALQILDVSENQLKSLSSMRKLKSLEDLNVSCNKISQLSGWGSILPKLQILNICDNMIAAWKQLCLLKEVPDLVEISLAGNPVTLEDGECPCYHSDIQTVLPALEIVDGAHVKRPSGKGGAAPLMRPMSASSVVSVRQVETQLKSSMHEQESLQKSIAERFSSLKSVLDYLPTHAPQSVFSSHSEQPPSEGDSAQSSRCSRRSRIRDAQAFAASLPDNNGDV